MIEAQRRLTPPFYGGQALGFYHIWAPGTAIWFQDDLSAILSPKLYRQFFLDSARLILAGHDHTAVHLHPNSFFILDELLTLENLKAVQVNKDISGPGIKEMLPVLAKIMQTRGLILWGDLTVEDLELVKQEPALPGTCPQCGGPHPGRSRRASEIHSELGVTDHSTALSNGETQYCKQQPVTLGGNSPWTVKPS